MDNLVKELASSPLYQFADWPNKEIPRVCAGVYTVYDSKERLIYVGMAGAGLSEAQVARKIESGKKSGLLDRLGSHASGYRSGDRFNIYIGDFYVLRQLTQSDLVSVANRRSSFDQYIREYIRKNLSYRYLVTPNNIVRKLEKYIQLNGVSGEIPSINGR